MYLIKIDNTEYRRNILAKYQFECKSVSFGRLRWNVGKFSEIGLIYRNLDWFLSPDIGPKYDPI